ncbi:hypothetical protein M885DRAFT_287701 [Pelagophyceae sp. CCMP2097]|nr:hypothetical protein M885DRAFT_287701 [Pelagophyceae sp. CCMP2097]
MAALPFPGLGPKGPLAGSSLDRRGPAKRAHRRTKPRVLGPPPGPGDGTRLLSPLRSRSPTPLCHGGVPHEAFGLFGLGGRPSRRSASCAVCDSASCDAGAGRGDASYVLVERGLSHDFLKRFFKTMRSKDAFRKRTASRASPYPKGATKCARRQSPGFAAASAGRLSRNDWAGRRGRAKGSASSSDLSREPSKTLRRPS